ncbi:MAG: MipA/OmpV family protein [Pseudomonadota bacterium]
MTKFSTPAAMLSLSLLSLAAHAAPPATPDSSVTLSAGLAVASEYSGSDTLRAFPVLAADYQNRNGFFASTTRGIGYQAKLEALSVSGALGYDGGRKDKKENLFSGSDALKGMGEIDGAPVARLGLGYDLGAVQFSAGADLALSHRERGKRYHFAASMPLLAGAGDRLSAAVSADYGDARNVQTFYGVTAAQSAASGFKAFKAKGGVEKVGLGLNWHHEFDKNWSLSSVAGLTRLTGDAANSPLSKRKTSPLLMSTVNYTF